MVDVELVSNAYFVNERLLFQFNFRDITQRWLAEQALQQSNVSLVEAQRLARVGNWHWETKGSEPYWSEEMFRIFGRDPKIGAASFRDIEKLQPSEAWSQLARAEDTALKSGVAYDLECRIMHTDGEPRWIVCRGEAVRNTAGKIEGLRGTVQDITARKQAEEDIRLLNTELEKRVLERTTELAASNKELHAFCYSVSHDLRSPLRGIDGWSQALSDDYADKLDKRGQEYLDRVRSESQRMGRLIDDMLKLARTAQVAMKMTPLDLSAMANTIFSRLREREPGRRVEIVVEPDLVANGDSVLLNAAMTNLIENAWKFTGKTASPRIEFGRIEQNGECIFFIRDNGAGFDMNYAQKLFAPFQRMHKMADFPGTGVGLATVQRIIHRHGGRIWVEAHVGRGAAFNFTLAHAPTTTSDDVQNASASFNPEA